MSNIFKLYPTHFSRGSKNFLGGSSPRCAPLVTGLVPSKSVHKGVGVNTSLWVWYVAKTLLPARRWVLLWHSDECVLLCGRLDLSVKSWPHNCEAGVRSLAGCFPWARNLALSCGGPKIATAHYAITSCITLLYRVRMPALLHASYAVIHVLWLCAPFRNE